MASPMEKRCVTPISLQATVMHIKKSLYFLTESLMPSIVGRFYHFREHVFQKETRVDSSIIFLSQYPKIQTAAKSTARIKKKTDVWLKYIHAILDSRW